MIILSAIKGAVRESRSRRRFAKIAVLYDDARREVIDHGVDACLVMLAAGETVRRTSN